MSDLFIWIYSGGGGLEVHETFYKSLGTSGLDEVLWRRTWIRSNSHASWFAYGCVVAGDRRMDWPGGQMRPTTATHLCCMHKFSCLTGVTHGTASKQGRRVSTALIIAKTRREQRSFAHSPVTKWVDTRRSFVFEYEYFIFFSHFLTRTSFSI
jgi:hypothetical protein